MVAGGADLSALEQVAVAEQGHRFELYPGDATHQSVGPLRRHCSDAVGQLCCHRAQVLAAQRRPVDLTGHHDEAVGRWA